MMKLEDTDIWLSASEIAALKLDTMPHSRAAVLKWAKKESWEKRERKGKGAGAIFSFVSFPNEAKEEIKNSPQIWEKVCNLSKDRRSYKTPIQKERVKNKLGNIEFLSGEGKNFAIECIHRLIFEEIRLGIKREDLATGLGLSLESFEKYEHGEIPLNVLQLKKLHKLGFDVNFILLGERKNN